MAAAAAQNRAALVGARRWCGRREGSAKEQLQGPRVCFYRARRGDGQGLWPSMAMAPVFKAFKGGGVLMEEKR
jgi:hypothetical protein